MKNHSFYCNKPIYNEKRLSYTTDKNCWKRQYNIFFPLNSDYSSLLGIFQQKNNQKRILYYPFLKGLNFHERCEANIK